MILNSHGRILSYTPQHKKSILGHMCHCNHPCSYHCTSQHIDSYKLYNNH